MVFYIAFLILFLTFVCMNNKIDKNKKVYCITISIIVSGIVLLLTGL